MPTGEPLDFTPERPILVYDADCGFCERSVGLLRRMLGGCVDYVPSHSLERHAPELARAVSDEDLQRSIKFVGRDGRLRHAADALTAVLAERWWLGLPRLLYRFLPGAAWLAERLYAVIARHRHRIGRWFGISGEVCRRPPTPPPK